MRLNVYSQELTKEADLVSKVANTGIVYYGIRLYLASPDVLHHTVIDDDRSAITFWIPNNNTFNRVDLANLFARMATIAFTAPDPQRND